MISSKARFTIKWAFGILASVVVATSIFLHSTGLRVTDLKLLPVAPSLAGCLHSQRYFVAFTSSAEARSLGGLLGQYAIIDLNCNSLEIEKVGTNLSLDNSRIFLRAQQKYPNIYLGNNTEWVNSNLFPDGELISSMWIEAYEKQSNQKIDGVIAVDLPMLVDLAMLAGFNLADKSGTVLTDRATILNYLLNGIYFDYPINNFKRKEVQLKISKNMTRSLSLISKQKLQVSKILFRALKENRLYIYNRNFANLPYISSHPIFYDVLGQKRTIFIGANNLSGNKFDFYNQFHYTLSTCQNFSRVLKIDIRNSASITTQYPDYLIRRLEGNPQHAYGSTTQIIAILPKGVEVISWKGPTEWQAETSDGNAGRIVINLVGSVDAGKRYVSYIKFKYKGQLELQSWGKRNESAPLSNNC